MPRRRHSWPEKTAHTDMVSAVWLLVVIVVFNGVGRLWADDDDDVRDGPRGLVVRHFADEIPDSISDGLENLPAYWLNAGESPNPRLAAGQWRVEAAGELESVPAGEYQFSADFIGRLRMELAGQVLIEVDAMDGGPKHVESKKLVLDAKRHPLRIDYRPAAAGARLRIRWRQERFDWEPIPRSALFPVAEPPPVRGAGPHVVANPLSVRFADRLAPPLGFQRGWLAVENHRCHACHSSPYRDHMTLHRGPVLSSAGQRLRRTWIAEWLADPGRLRPEATMPRLFSADSSGDVERQVVAEYLTAGEGSSMERFDAPQVSPADAAEGKSLFERIGCANCHQSFQSRMAAVTVAHLETKTGAVALEKFLHDPAAVYPDGRMPRFDLSGDERRQLAAYLLTKDRPASDSEPAAIAFQTEDVASALRQYAAEDVVAALSPAEQRRELARRVIVAKRCEACHELSEDAGRPKPALATVDITSGQARLDAGCLDKERQAPGNRAPFYGSLPDRATMVEFLRDAGRQPVTPAPSFQARLTLERLNCLACHVYNGNGGLPAELAAQLLAGLSESSAEAVHPPPLTGVAEKLTLSALRDVLVHGSRVRPWMSLRMPHFSGIERLPEQLTALAGVARDESPGDVLRQAGDDDQTQEAARAAGRTLVGARGFGCVKCHDLQGIASQGTRGPDLSLTPRRIQRDWYRRWMSDPQRIIPGTRMPTVFLDGQSPHAEILDGDPAQQRDAIWQYLLASHAMPLPEGVERATPQRLAVGGRPLVVRTFLPGLSARGMAIGFPQDLHLLYDAQACRLAGMFQGGFLDMSAAWSGRGGSAAKMEGTIVWQAPAGFPWELATRSIAPPDFSGREQDPALGGPVREAPPYAPSRLRFDGYTLEANGPTMRFRLATADAAGEEASVLGRFEEKLSTVRTDLGVAARRDATVRTTEALAAWLLAARADAAPIHRTASESSALGDDTMPARGAVLQLFQDGQPLLLQATGDDSWTWQAVQREGRWHVLLRSDTQPADDGLPLRIDVWRPSSNREETIQRLVRFLMQTAAQ